MAFNWTYLKTNWISILVLVLFLWVIFKPSGCGPVIGGKSGNDTIRVETKTEQVPQPPVYIPMYIPQQTGATNYPVVIPQNYQPSGELASLTKQYNELVKEYLATRTYKDSIQLKDTAGNKVGVVNLNDVVSENQIKSREPSYQLNFPHTTTTITIREPYKPKGQLYIGGGIQGNTTLPVNGINAGLLYKTKKDRIFNVTAGIQHYGTIVPAFGINSYWKIGKK